MRLELPDYRVSDRVTFSTYVDPGQRVTLAELDGPGCIGHIWLVMNNPKRDPLSSRRAIIRIYFDGEPVPYVEAPAGDFFGVMHGEGYYDINSVYLSVKAWNGYNCYFPMPFAESARIELEVGAVGSGAHMQVDWHRFPDQPLTEKRRFCARWRRQNPARRYADEFLMLDADGPGQLVGFVHGVRLLDDTDRWSHGGADNIYIDGEGDHPAFIRGLGGEDVYGAGFGGNLHPVDSHLYAGMPFYELDDQGVSRPAPKMVGYRFFVPDSIEFRQSIQLRFGCMANDICTTAYWYQDRTVRPFFVLPDFEKLIPGSQLPVGEGDLALPDRGAWLVRAPLADGIDAAIDAAGATAQSVAPADWTAAKSHHGFVDFNHYAHPDHRNAGAHCTGVVGVARCVLESPRDVLAVIQLAWDDELVMKLNDQQPMNLGRHAAFRARRVEVALKAGKNHVALALSNESGSNHGGWAFALRCTGPDGPVLPAIGEPA